MARSEICKYCCPSGGAVFDVVVSRAFIEFDGNAMDFEGLREVKKCRNCGTEKPLRFRKSAKKKAERARQGIFPISLTCEGSTTIQEIDPGSSISLVYHKKS